MHMDIRLVSESLNVNGAHKERNNSWKYQELRSSQHLLFLTDDKQRFGLVVTLLKSREVIIYSQEEGIMRTLERLIQSDRNSSKPTAYATHMRLTTDVWHKLTIKR